MTNRNNATAHALASAGDLAGLADWLEERGDPRAAGVRMLGERGHYPSTTMRESSPHPYGARWFVTFTSIIETNVYAHWINWQPSGGDPQWPEPEQRAGTADYADLLSAILAGAEGLLAAIERGRVQP